jgi:sec-independent protein translocase protein TatC
MTSNWKESSFWGHLEELLSRLRTIFYSLVISVIIVSVVPVGFDPDSFSIFNLNYDTITILIINNIQKTFLPPDVELIPISWVSPLQVYLYVSVLLGITISLPIIIYELYKFTAPALYEQEKENIVPLIFSTSALFIIGFFLGYFLIMPQTLRLLLFSAESLGLSLKYEFSQFFSLVAGGLFVCGFVMTCPVYLVLLVKAKLLETELIKKNRKYIYGGILIAIALVDPDPTLLTELFLGIPVILVFEIAIKLASRFERKAE